MNIEILKYEDIENFSDIPEEWISNKDKRKLFLALNNKTFIACLSGTFINETLFNIIDITILEKDLSEQIHSSFCNYLFSEFLPLGIEILSWDKPENETINTYLEKSGFKVFKKKVFVEKQLENYIMPYDNPFTFKALSELGESYFIEMMVKAATGDPFEDPESNPENDFQDLIDYAGEKFNPDWWKVAYINEIPVGVVLPQVFSYGTDEGSLFYLGIIPEYRGKGLGKIIHATGLDFLSKENIIKYKGSTDIENKSMINIFNKNNCIQTGTQIIYKIM